MSLSQLLTLGIGILCAAVIILIVKMCIAKKQCHVAALGLVLVAVIYPVAILWGDVDFGQWFVEVIIALVLSGVAYIGFYGNNDKVLAMGWIAHAGWDFMMPHASGILPESWALWCAGFDVTIGLYLWLDREKFDPSIKRIAMNIRNGQNAKK